MASNMSWGGMPFLTPSPTCYKYLHEQTRVVPERSIRIGARYRARKNLVEHVSRACRRPVRACLTPRRRRGLSLSLLQVRGYRLVKKSLQRRLAEIESDRKNAHYQLPEMCNVIHQIFT